MNKKSQLYRIGRSIYFGAISVEMTFLRVVNFFIPKEKHRLMFIPSENCRVDKYNIINNASDNVLKLCDGIIKDERFKSYHLSIAVYNEEEIRLYKDYCDRFGFEGNIDFFLYDNRRSFFWMACRSSAIFSANFYWPIRYKVSRQIVMCLGYFVVPFKDDYFKIKRLGYKEALKIEKRNNRIFDYHLSTSTFCSRELSVDSLLYLPKYQPLGFPRNDIFFDDSSTYRQKIVKALGFNPKTILAFVPTHRDYERKSHFLYDAQKTHPHSLFGDITVEDNEKLNDFLEKENLVIIAKAHPMQDKNNITGTNSNRIVYFSDLIQNCQTSLQEILAASDIMATDYSTACFDFLLTDRPSIYYFYDYVIQRNSRDFFIDPITPVCAGDVVYNLQDFMLAVKNNIENPDRFAEQRKFVRNLLFYNNDGNSTKRVTDFVYAITN